MPPEAIILNFGMQGDIADVITHAKFYVNQFRDFGVLTPPILPFSIGLAGNPYNSVSTSVLHCVNSFAKNVFFTVIYGALLSTTMLHCDIQINL